MNVKSRNLKRKWRYSRSRNPLWLDSLAALLIAAAAHALFFGVFKYEEQNVETAPQSSQITICNLASLPKDMQERSLKWLEMHDPKLAVRGDSHIGFSSFAPELKNKKVPLKEFKIQFDLPEVKAVRYRSGRKKNAQMNSIPDVPVLAEHSRAGSIVLNSKGEEISVDLGGIKPVSAGVSTFAVRGKGLLKRVEIIKSSAKVQDELAANILLHADIRENENITVIWRVSAK